MHGGGRLQQTRAAESRQVGVSGLSGSHGSTESTRTTECTHLHDFARDVVSVEAILVLERLDDCSSSVGLDMSNGLRD